jgi:hypothetical protein
MLRFAGMALASLAALATLMLDCAGLAGAACAVRASACAPALAAGSWVACVAQPHRMAASANTVFFMLLSLLVVGKDPLWRTLYLRKYVLWARTVPFTGE